MQEYIDKLKGTYFGWFIENLRVSIMIILLILWYGTYSMMSIPKESSPDIKFGIVSIVTTYAWANPVDIDNQITTKLETEIKNIDGIDKIQSNSSVWASMIYITLENGTDVQNFVNETKSKIDQVILPSDAKNPIVSEISTENETLFQMILYGSREYFTINQIRSLAMDFKDDIKGKWWIVDVVINGVNGDSDYDVSVLLDKSKIEEYGLTVWWVVWQIRAYNNSIPLWNHVLWTLNYDYRIDNELKTLWDLQKVPIKLWNADAYIYLSDISKIERKYKNKSYSYWWIRDDGDNYAVTLTIQKKDGVNIFEVTPWARQIIEQTIKKVKYDGIKMQYTQDLADVIVDDYQSLWSNAISSIFLVLLITALFIWFRQSIIATVLMILSFFITFIVLKAMGMTMNFLTNFSLILAFGSWIDTVIVFIEAAYENMKRWFDPKTAILLSINTYKSANINTSLINLCVFIPLLSLPGIMGKFVSFIPITIFATLLWSLILALTLNGAVFAWINKPLKYYYEDGEIESDVIMPDVERQILEQEKVWKIPHHIYIQQEVEKENQIAIKKNINNRDDRTFWQLMSYYISNIYQSIKYIFSWIPKLWDKVFDIVEHYLFKLENIYTAWLKRIIANKSTRIFWTVWPVVALILSFVLLSSSIWFKLFPSGDNSQVNLSIYAKQWTSTEQMNKIWSGISNTIAWIQGVKSFEVLINNNTIDLWVYLTDKPERCPYSNEYYIYIKNKINNISWEEEYICRDSFMILDQINEELEYLAKLWYKVEWKVLEWWPPSEKAIGIKLIANESKYISDLKNVADDFEKYLKTLSGASNINNSSQESPWQFEYKFDTDKLSQLWLNPNDIQSELYTAINGTNAWNITVEWIDRDIIVKIDKFDADITPELISNTIINTRSGPINIWSIANIKISKSVSNINREDGDIVVTVDADAANWFNPTDIQPKFVGYAEKYDFPTWISYKIWWENAENQELVVAIWIAFVIAMLIAFAILVYQFNSFGLTLIVLYSILTAMLWVNIWLWVTGNPYSLPVMIWFISLMWVVVNTAIFLVDRIKYNLEHWADINRAILEAWSMRFKPIIISSITTILWVWSVVTQDDFYAALGWTIVFGLIFSAVITLMAVPALVYIIKWKTNKTQ